MMENETRANFGTVPHSLHGEPLREMWWHLRGDEFLLRATGEHYFHYRISKGVMIERGSGADCSEESLWFNGSVYAAIASMNGLLPIHASAVAMNGQVFAFTGDAGAGKSTLIAALGRRGLPMFCDDTLVLDLSDPDRILCLPGHKRLKLRPDAIAMTGARQEEQVSRTVDKYYSKAPAGDIDVPLPIAWLVFLEEGDETTIAPISGGSRLNRLQDDHQTAHLFAAARQFDRAEHFHHLARLASQIEMARFSRPRDPRRFHQDVERVATWIEQEAFR
jgi:hypothetical protein